MEFVNPGFLYGLIAVAIPVIIHLFNFRRFRKVFFTNVEFIKELKQETRKQSKLKHLLVLLARILAVAAIVLAFARPYIPVEENMLKAAVVGRPARFGRVRIRTPSSLRGPPRPSASHPPAIDDRRELSRAHSPPLRGRTASCTGGGSGRGGPGARRGCRARRCGRRR